uniref:Uncharacterized protein n=1 Tax=Anopheles minimus TaxID=112268 RepID=A0A182WN68_9DIPT
MEAKTINAKRPGEIAIPTRLIMEMNNVYKRAKVYALCLFLEANSPFTVQQGSTLRLHLRAYKQQLIHRTPNKLNCALQTWKKIVHIQALELSRFIQGFERFRTKCQYIVWWNLEIHFYF